MFGLFLPLAGLVVEPALDRPHDQILDEPRGTVDQMRAVAESVLERFLVAFGHRNPIGHDKHGISSSWAGADSGAVGAQCRRRTKGMKAPQKQAGARSEFPVVIGRE